MMRGPKLPGVDLANLNVQVTLRRPPQLSANLVEYYVNLVNSAQTLISTFQTITNQLVSPETYSNLLLQLGMPENIARLFGAIQLPTTTPQQLFASSMNRDIVCTNKDIIEIQPDLRKNAIRPLVENLKKREAA